MKRISLRVFVILIFTMVLSMVFLAINPNMTKAEVITSSDGKWKYEKLEDNTIKITDINQIDKSQTLLEIPEQIDGLTVSSIDLREIECAYDAGGSSSFDYIMKIPKTINDIGVDTTFGGNKVYYRKVRMYDISEENNTYKSVDGVIFSKDGKELVRYPGGTINRTYTIPEGVETIKRGAFKNVYNTYTLIFPSTMKSLEVSALGDYTELKTLDIKNYNGELENNVFMNNAYLKEFIVDSENTAYSAIDGVLFNKEQNLIIKYPHMKEGETYTIPKGVDISEGCFKWNKYLKFINIESNITKIPESAFDKSNITSIVLPNTVKKIGSGAFNYCAGLKSIVLPDGLETIEDRAFMLCENLETINIPNTITEIEDAAFLDSGVKTFTFPEKITKISFQVLEDCKQLESVYIPDGVTHIADYAFSSCSALKSINIPVSVEEIGYNAFNHSSNFTVKCEKNSYAYEWAMQNKESKNLTLEVTDTIAPVCKNITVKTSDGKKVYSDTKINSNLYYTITFSEDVVGFTKDDIEVTNGTKGTFFGSGSKYTLIVTNDTEGEQVVKISQGACTDSAGNEIAETVKKVVIDRTGPVGSVSYSTTEKTGSAVVAKISANEEMQEIEGWTLSADKKELTKSYEDNTEETVTIKDLLGNESSVTIKISNIDKTLPKGEVTYSTAEYTNQDVTVTINVDKQVQAINGWTLSENKAGNRSIVTVKIANIDKEAPVIGEITLSTKEITNQDVEITVNATDAISGIEGYSWDEKQTWYTVNKVNAKTNGIYTIYVKDKAGNISSKTIKITNINKEPEKLAISATKYKVDGNYIINIKPATKVSEVKNDVKSNREYEIQKTDGTKLTENDIVATGYKVKFATGETYEIVVNGDVSGDGKITITDVAKIKKHIISLEKLTGAYLKAGDVNENDTVTVTDLAKIKKVIIGLVNL